MRISIFGMNMKMHPMVATSVMSRKGTHDEAIQSANMTTMIPSTYFSLKSIFAGMDSSRSLFR